MSRARESLAYSSQTCSVWEEEYAKLSIARSNTLPPLGSRSQIQDWDRPTPPHWDSISFADDLKHAYVQICQPLGFNRTNSSKNYEPHLQRNITAQLCERRPARDLAATLNYRLRKLTKHPRDKDPLAIGAIITALATASKASGHVAWQLIVSWCNAWNTDVAQSTTPCRFGCRSGTDDLTHYIRCRNLTTPCSLAAGLPPLATTAPGTSSP